MDRSYQTGEFTNNKLYGQGTKIWPEAWLSKDKRVKYSGNFDDDHPNDENGRMDFEDKVIYLGKFVYGIMQGKGKKIWPNGDVYTGDF